MKPTKRTAKRIAKQKIYRFKDYHGLHVFDDVFVKSCPACRLRSQIMILARLEGQDPEKAISDATKAREMADVIAARKGK